MTPHAKSLNILTVYCFSDQPNYFNCKDSFTLLIAIKSAIYEFNERQTIRETWGIQVLQLDIYYYFVVGNSKNDTLNQLLDEESFKFNDILKINVIDNYHQLTLKTYMHLCWISNSCPSDKLIFFTDCDVILIPERLYNFTLYYRSNDTIGGHCWLTNSKVERNSSLPNYTPRSLWNESTFPRFCSGAAHFMTVSIIRKILHAIPMESDKIGYVKRMDFLDDVTFTGILRLKSNLKIQHRQEFIWLNPSKFKNFCADEKRLNEYICNLKKVSVINSFRPLSMYKFCWNNILNTLSGCNVSLSE